MATLPKNNIVRSIAPKSIFESSKNVLSATNDFNQGDLIAFDTSLNVLKAVSATADAEFILGVSRFTVIDGKVKSPYSTSNDASAAIEDLAGPVFGVVAEMKLKSGDAFTPGIKVYVTTTDAQTVSITDPGDHFHIGIYQGKSVTAGASSVGDVLIGARYGMAGLII